jgi:enoyl-CoA hydratase/carnithine racemase
MGSHSGQAAAFLPHLSEFFSLPWVTGPRRAKQILFANRPLSAEQALDFGMVSEVVPAGQLIRPGGGAGAPDRRQ